MATVEFEFIVEGPPCTANNDNAKKKIEWKQSVGKAAYAKWIADGRSDFALPIRIRLEVYVTTYCGKILHDVDNILKWTLDGLKAENDPEYLRNRNVKQKRLAKTYKPIYADDGLIYKVTSERIELAKVKDNWRELPSWNPLLEQAAQDFREFLHLVIQWEESEEKNDADGAASAS